MKKLILITTPLLLVACTQNMPTLQPMPTPTPTTATAALPAEAARQGQYLALPGQGAIDTDAAFDQQAAAYANTGAVATAPVATQTQIDPLTGAIVAVPVTPTVPAGAGVLVTQAQTAATPATPTYVDPYAAVVTAGNQAVNAVAGGAAAIAGSASGMMPGTVAGAMSGPVDYTLRITNATPGRVFIEAQDAAGEIYPCGFMTGSQSISTVKKQVNPIQGPITVVVRDPDKPDAPELRRYKVDPPAGYAGKTIEITIISGGLYQVSVDGQVRYITPTPVGKPDLGTHEPPAPAAPAASAAAPAVAEPAPAAEPAGL